MRAGTCKFFTGYQNGTCKAGQNYRQTVGGEDFGWAARLPCIPDSPINKPPLATCEKFCARTVEEEKAERKEIDERQSFLIAALNAIRATKPKRGSTGTIECPKCKGSLGFSVAKSNGHIWGKCSTDGCLAWMM